MSTGINYLRAAFIAYEPGADSSQRRAIPFRFNPEGLSRSISVEQGEGSPGTQGAGGSSGGDGSQASDGNSGSVKESFTVQVRLDFADRLEATRNLPEELGVAPEIAAIEDLVYPAPSEAEAAETGNEAVRQRQPRPTVLFVWGRKRVLPVRITGITINETVHNIHLNPVRAEIEVSVEVMGDADARDNEAVRSALDFTQGERRKLAKQFYDNTADQASNILPI